MCTNWRESAHSGERNALCIWAHGQTDICIGPGHAAFKWIQPPQKSGHSYFLRFMEQCRAVVKEVSFVFCRMYRPHLPSTNHVNAELCRALPHCYNIWEAHCDPVWPLDASPSHSPYEAFDHIFGSSVNCFKV
jgi:hypothetical protein